ncbi:MAG: hypothetical protein RR996_01830 [Alistipes sp.]
MSNPLNEPLLLQMQIRDTLAADPYYAEHRVNLMIQDSGELAAFIAEKTRVLSGPVLMITITSIEGNAPAAIYSIDLIITESVMTNRACAGFDTALGIAWHAAQAMTATDDYRFDRINHYVNDDGIFQAVVSLTY